MSSCIAAIADSGRSGCQPSQWLIEHRRPRSVHLLVMTSKEDPQSRPQALGFLRRERNVAGIEPYLVQNLGHSLDAYQAVLAPILGWLAAVADA